MIKVFRVLALLGTLLFLVSCGSKKGPTGGPEDLEKPTVLTSLPAQYSQLDNGRIEINFSKSLDKSSITQAVYIYPPVTAKKISVDKSTLLIRINEDLLPDTNYYVTLSTRLKDIRGNALAENQTLVFAHGRLQQERLAGKITYEEPGDSGLPVSLSLLSPDSLTVLNHTALGESYALETLNPTDYILRGFIDKDKNGRFDFTREPSFSETVNVRRSASLDISLAYADTTLPVIRTVAGKSPREIEVTFSEAVASIGQIKVVNADGSMELPVLLSALKGNKLTLLTGIQNQLTYVVEARQIRDMKGNSQLVSKAEFRANPKDDVTPPMVKSTNPRNGTSVASLEPRLEVQFSEIIPSGRLQASLRATESNAEIPLEILQADSDVYRFKPRQTLQNYRSYVLTVSAQDISGNTMPEEYKLNFLPLLRSE